MRFWTFNIFGIPVETTGASAVFDAMFPEPFVAHGQILEPNPTTSPIMFYGSELPEGAIAIGDQVFEQDIDTWDDQESLGRA